MASCDGDMAEAIFGLDTFLGSAVTASPSTDTADDYCAGSDAIYDKQLPENYVQTTYTRRRVSNNREYYLRYRLISIMTPA